MATIQELQAQLTRCTDPKKYDELKAQINQVLKAADLDNAKRLDAIDEAAKKERAELEASHAANVATIESLYQQIETVDRDIFELVAQLSGAVDERLALSAEADDLETAALASAGLLRVPFQRRGESLLGGQPLQKDAHSLIKLWLQRFEDYRERLGEKVTPEVMSAHGLQGGTESEDRPGRY